MSFCVVVEDDPFEPASLSEEPDPFITPSFTQVVPPSILYSYIWIPLVASFWLQVTVIVDVVAVIVGASADGLSVSIFATSSDT